METVRLTTAQAIVRYLIAQRVEDGSADLPLFAGVFAIFGHGNVTCLGEALEKEKDRLPTWRGQNEQTMAMAAVAFAKARRRRQMMVATSSIGPGAANMVTAAGIAMANRLPLLLLSGDTFANRLPDPVLQQVEHFGDPTLTVNDAFKAVCRYLGPHHPPGTDHQQLAPGRRHHARSRRCAVLRFSGWPRTSRPRPSTIPSSSSPNGSIGFGDPVPTHPSWRLLQPCSVRPTARW